MARRPAPAEPAARAGPPGWSAADLALIDGFVASLRNERRLSRHTSAAYRRDLAAFLAWCVKSRLTSWCELDAQQLRNFAAASHRGGLAPRSIQRQLSALRTFFGFLIREGVLKRSPAIEVRAPKGAKRLPQALDVDRMARLLDAPVAARPALAGLDARDRAILELFYSSGLRLAELVGLDLPDIDLADRTVRVLGKGNKARIVPVGSKAAAAIVAWLAERPALAATAERALFVGRNGGRLGVRAVQLRVDAWARRHGLDVKVHPHLFRHSFATHLLESSHDLRGVQELLGHANIGTTQVYTHLDFQHLARIYDAAHPRARRRTR